MPAPLDFYNTAVAAGRPKGKYASAREQLADLPAIIMAFFGAEGARTVAWFVAPYKGTWRRSDRGFFDRWVAFASRALYKPDLNPELRATFLAIALAGRLFAAVEYARS